MATYRDKPDWSLATNEVNVLLRSISCNYYEFAHLRDGKYYGANGEFVPEMWHVVEHRRIDLIEVNANKHDQDKPMYNLLPANAIDSMAMVLTFGAKKYAPEAWQSLSNKKPSM